MSKNFLFGNHDDFKELNYDIRYQKMGIGRIIKEFSGVEKDIIDDVLMLLVSFLEKNNAIIKGDIFELDGTNVKIYIDFERINRVLIIKLFPLVPQSTSSIVKQFEINSFGAIKTLKFEYPSYYSKLEDIFEVTINQLRYAYLCIEKAFKTSFISFSGHLFRQLYDILNVEIERQGKMGLLSKSYFEVTLRSSHKFRFFFDGDELQQLINFFKENQLPDYSPFEMILTLLTEEATHTINMLKGVKEGQSDTLDSKNFKSLEQNYRFWSAESLLIKFKAISVYTAFANDKVILQLAYPSELENEFSKICEMAKTPLANQFKDNVKNYTKYSNELSKVPKINTPYYYNQQIAEFIGTILGKGLSEFIY